MSVDLSQVQAQLPQFHVFYPVERISFYRYCFHYKISLLASPNFTTHCMIFLTIMYLKKVFSKRKLERFSKTRISNKCDKKVN